MVLRCMLWVLLGCGLACPLWAAEAAIDPTFGGAGEAVFDSPVTNGKRASATKALCPRGDGGFWGLFESHGYTRLSVAHFLPGGQPDISFGTQGRTTLAVDLTTGLAPLARCAEGGRILFWRRRAAGDGPMLMIEVQQVGRDGVLQPAALLDGRDLVPGLTELALVRSSPVTAQGYYLTAAVRSSQFPDRRVLLLRFDSAQHLLASRVIEVGSVGYDEAAKVVGLGPDGRVWLFGDVIDASTGERTWWANARDAQTLAYAAQRIGSETRLSVFSGEWVRADLIAAAGFSEADGQWRLLGFAPARPDLVQQVGLPIPAQLEGQPVNASFPMVGAIDADRALVSMPVFKAGDDYFGLAQRLYVVRLDRSGPVGLVGGSGDAGVADWVVARCPNGSPWPQLPEDDWPNLAVGGQVLLAAIRKPDCAPPPLSTDGYASLQRLLIPEPSLFRSGFDD